MKTETPKEDLSVYVKINKAIAIIKDSDLKKAGRNTFSNYDYFTPEQIDSLVHNACKELNLFIKFQLVRDQIGIFGQMNIIDLDNGQSEQFVMASDIPSIKATNISQQLGGAMTYTKRYMCMNIFDIVDNNLDFDTYKEQTTAPEKSQVDDEIEWLKKGQYDKALKSDIKGITATLNAYQTREKKMKKEYHKALTHQLGVLKKQPDASK